MAAGAVISLTLAVSPSLTLLPPLPVAVDANGTVTSQQNQTTETLGAAIADPFEVRGQAAADDIPPIPAPKGDRLIGGVLTLPLAQDAPQVSQVEPRDLADAAQAEQQEPVKVVLNEPPARPNDVCARHGLRRVEYTQNRHRYWRCAGRR